MQILKFSDGGFVIHRITSLGNTRISAWYDKSGKLLDFERFKRFDSRRLNNRVTADTRVRLEMLGRVHNPTKE